MSAGDELDGLAAVASNTEPETRVSLNLHAYIALMYAQRDLREGFRESDEQQLLRGMQGFAAALDALADGGCWIHAPSDLPKPG